MFRLRGWVQSLPHPLTRKNKGKGRNERGEKQSAEKGDTVGATAKTLRPASLCVGHYSSSPPPWSRQSWSPRQGSSTSSLPLDCSLRVCLLLAELIGLVNTVTSFEIAVRWRDPEGHMGDWIACVAEAGPVVCLRAQLTQEPGMEVKWVMVRQLANAPRSLDEMSHWLEEQRWELSFQTASFSGCFL